MSARYKIAECLKIRDGEKGNRTGGMLRFIVLFKALKSSNAGTPFDILRTDRAAPYRLHRRVTQGKEENSGVSNFHCEVGDRATCPPNLVEWC